MEALVQMYVNQGGRCKYTKVPLRVTGPYKFSIERVKDHLEYSLKNVVLVIAEVNVGLVTGGAKWSKEKADAYWGEEGEEAGPSNA